jgi:hypothetical protein
MHHAVVSALAAFVLVCIAFMLFFRRLPYDIDMTFSHSCLSFFFASIATAVVAQNASKVDLGWYAPKKSWVNDFDQVLNGTGTNGFVFNSSQLPTGVDYGTYNWCNM